jgi:hypothetical protein
MIPAISQLRVVPAPSVGWRIEGPVGVRGVCATASDAEALAERLVRDNGGGEILIYDENLRLRAVKRLPAALAPEQP